MDVLDFMHGQGSTANEGALEEEEQAGEDTSRKFCDVQTLAGREDSDAWRTVPTNIWDCAHDEGAANILLRLARGHGLLGGVRASPSVMSGRNLTATC